MEYLKKNKQKLELMNYYLKVRRKEKSEFNLD